MVTSNDDDWEKGWTTHLMVRCIHIMVCSHLGSESWHSCLDPIASTMTEINDPKRCQGCSGSGQVTKYFLFGPFNVHLGSSRILMCLTTWHSLVSLLVKLEALPKTRTCEKLDFQIFSANEVLHRERLGWRVLPCQTVPTRVHWLWWSWVDGDLWKMMLVRSARCWCCHFCLVNPRLDQGVLGL